MYFSHFFISLVTAGGGQEVFLWNKEVCLGYCIMFCCTILKAVIQLLYIFEIDSKFH